MSGQGGKGKGEKGKREKGEGRREKRRREEGRGETYLSDSERTFNNLELVRGEAPDTLLIGGVAEFTKGLVASGGKAYDDDAAVLLIRTVNADRADKLPGHGASGVLDDRVVRDTDECGIVAVVGRHCSYGMLLLLMV